MLSFPGSVKVYLGIEAVDLRKSFTGLWSLSINELKEDPKSGALFIFTNKRRNRIKILYYDGSGLWVMTKRLERGTFSWPQAVEAKNGKLELRAEALSLLLDGVDLRGASMRPWYQR